MGQVLLGVAIGFFLGRFVSWCKRNDWKDDPPTDKQLDYAEDLGIKVPKKATKGEVSALIDAAKGKSNQ